MTKSELIKQFVLTQCPSFVPQGWHVRERGSWFLATHPSLPVAEIRSDEQRSCGWLLGYPISTEGELSPKRVLLPADISFAKGNVQDAAVESWVYEHGGRYALILIGERFSRIYLDPCGSLAMVYSLKKPIVASTPTLIDGDGHDWDEDLVKIIGLPGSRLYYPSGLTPRQFVRRLIPNHFLDLSEWKAVRHWPKAAKYSFSNEPSKNVNKIIDVVKMHLSAIAKKYPLHLSLTAGRDSRMLLACAQEVLDKTLFYTFRRERKEVDSYIAGLLSSRFNLNHMFFDAEYASEEEFQRDLYRIGNCAADAISCIRPTTYRLDPNRALLPGLAGEVGRCFYWNSKDTQTTVLDAEGILDRLHIPPVGEVLEKTRDWLGELSDLPTFFVLDLAYIEQRLGCWASPYTYATDFVTACHILPFVHRNIFEAMLLLPPPYRWRQQLATDILRVAWPELSDLPFNDYPGIRGYRGRILKSIVPFAKKILGRNGIRIVRKIKFKKQLKRLKRS